MELLTIRGRPYNTEGVLSFLRDIKPLDKSRILIETQDMPTVIYQALNSGWAAGSTNVQALPAVKRGRIIGFSIDVVGTGGAAAGIFNLEITKNNQAGGLQGPATQANPQRELSVGSLTGVMSTGANHNFSKVLTGIDIPFEVGDQLFIGSRLVSGTAPATAYSQVTVYVQE